MQADLQAHVRDRLPPTVVSLVDSVREKDVLLFAGGLAFYGLVSIAPFIVIAFWIAGAFVDEESFRQFGERLDELAPGGADLAGTVDSLASVGTNVGMGALLSAMWPATAYGSGLVRAFDRISHRPDRSLQGVHGRSRALVFVVLLPVFLLSALGISALATNVAGDEATATVLGSGLGLGGGFVAGFLTLSLIYLLFGPGRLPFRAVAHGAAAAAAGISVMSSAYILYLGHGADFEERIAGSGLASVVLLALWLYLANAMVLVGFALARSSAGVSADPEESPDDGARQSSAASSSSSSSISSTMGSSTSVRR